jgi:hypothetical protein
LNIIVGVLIVFFGIKMLFKKDKKWYVRWVQYTHVEAVMTLERK